MLLWLLFFPYYGQAVLEGQDDRFDSRIGGDDAVEFQQTPGLCIVRQGIGIDLPVPKGIVGHYESALAKQRES